MRDGGSARVVTVDGVLDLRRAHDLTHEVLSVPEGEEVLIVFSPEARCELAALSLFADAVTKRHGGIAVRGLAAHDLRVLRYLGVSFDGSP